MATRSFPKDLLRKILCGKTPGKVHDQITDNGRWSIHHKMIFKAKDGLHYQTHYSVGATEYQDETPFEYAPVQIECEQVEQVEKTVLVWEPVK